jgi:hypothetical protein
MYLFVSGTHFASFYDFSIVIWNFSDRVVFVLFIILLIIQYKEILPVNDMLYFRKELH